MQRRAASMTRCSCIPRPGSTNVIVRQIYPLCLAVNRSHCVMSHAASSVTHSIRQNTSEKFGTDQLGDLGGVGQVPPALVADEAEQHAGDVVGRRLGLH